MVVSSQTFQNTGLHGSYVSLSTILTGPEAFTYVIQMASVRFS